VSASEAPAANGEASEAETESKAGVKLHAMFSKINEKLSDLFSSLGVKQTLNVPFVHGEDMSNHVQAVAVAAKQAGTPLVKIFLTPHHASGGRGWKSGDGATHGYTTEELSKTVIPKDYPQAAAAISATKSYLNGISKLMPDEPTVERSKEQLKLIAAADGAGMNLFHFGTALQQLVAAPTAAIAKAHNEIKPGRAGHPVPSLPHEPTAEEAPESEPEPEEPEEK
jgi:hypothetical protein